MRSLDVPVLKVIVFTVVSTVVSLFIDSAHAQSGPHALNVSGGLFDSQGEPVLRPGINFKLEVRDKSGTCVLYSELHNGENLSDSKGQFSLLLGAGSSPQNFLAGGTQLNASVFLNRGPTGLFSGCPAGVTLASGDERVIRIYYDLGTGLTPMSPDVPIVSSAYAMVADSLQGKGANEFIQVADDGTTSALNQVNTEYAFSLANWPKLKALIDGSSTQYLAVGGTSPLDLNNQRIIRVANPGTSPFDAANKGYVDANLGGRSADYTGVGAAMGDGKTMVWDQGAQKWVVGNPQLTGTAGGDLSGSYPNPSIAALAVTTGKLADNAITSAKVNATGIAINRLVATDGVSGTTLAYFTCLPGEIMWWTTNGWQCTTVAAQSPVKTVAGRTPDAAGNVPLNANDITGLGTIVTKDYGSAAGQVPLLDAGAKIPSYMLPTGLGTITAVTAVAPVLGGGTSGNVTISIDVGTGANQVVRLNGSAQIPAVDGSLLTGVNASKIGTRAVASTAPTAAQVLAFNATSSQWEPMSAATGSVSSVASGVGLVSGTITSAGTINVDVGTTAGKIVQLNGSGAFPAIDAASLYNVNATKLATRAVASTAPSANQVLAYNATLSQWEPMSDAGGTMTSVTAGAGLVAGVITTSGTLNVDVGTGANKIVQLNGSASFPAIDSSNLYNVNASKLATRAVATTAPSPSQVLGYNATLAQWEPMSASTGSVTSVTAGVGLAGGPITSSGTLNVDVGSTAGKIVQENAGAQIAQLDGSSVAPSYSFASGTGNGMYLSSTNQLSFATAGTSVLTLFADGTVGAANDLGVYENRNKDATLYVTNASPGYAASLMTNAQGLYSRVTNGAVSGGVTTIWSAGLSGTTDYVISGTGSMPLVLQKDAPSYSLYVQSSGNLGVGTNLPRVALDIASTGTNSAILLPRDTTANRPAANVANGMIRYNTSTSKFEAYENGAWVNMTASGAGSGDFRADGSVSMTGAFKALDGTAVAPGMTFTAQNNTGFYRYATGIIAVTNNGTASALLGPTAVASTYINGAYVNLAPSSAALPGYTFTGNTATGLHAPGSNALELVTGGASRLHLDAAGNVGVGTTTPSVGLEIGSTGTSSAILVPRDTTANRPAGNVANGMMRYNTSTAKFEAYENGAWANMIAAGGGTTAFPLLANPGTTPASAPSYSFNGNAKTGLFSQATNTLSLATAGTARLTLDATGKVELTANSGSGDVLKIRDLSPAGFSEIQFAQDDGTPGGWIGHDNSTDRMFINSAGTRPVLIGTSSGTERMRIEDSGKVGIGTIAPMAALDIGVSGTNSALIIPRDTTANRPVTNVTNGMMRYNSSTNKFEAFENGAWSNMIAAGGGTTAFPLLANPGTTPATAPSYSFNGNANTGLLSQSANTIAVATAGTARLSVDAVGNVGIGTALPATKLEVAGALRLSTTATDNFVTPVGSSVATKINVPYYDPGAYGQIMAVGLPGTAPVTARALTLFDARTVAHQPTLSVLSPDETQYLGFSFEGGNTVGYVKTSVGLGFSVGGYPLVAITKGTATDAIVNVISPGAADRAGIQFSNTTGIDAGYVGLQANRSSFDVNSQYFGIPLRFATYGGTAMTILSTGEIGVGGSSPKAALDVAGSGTNSALIIPRDTTANRPVTNVTNGMMRYNSSTNKFEAFENGAWSNMIAAGGGTTAFPLLANPGTTAPGAPSYSFNGNANTGFFSPAANSLALATAGVTRLNIDASGNVGIGVASTSIPLEVANNAAVTTTDGSPTLGVYNKASTGAQYPQMLVLNYAGTSAGFPVMQTKNARGSQLSISASQSGDVLGQYSAQGHTGSGWSAGAFMQFNATENYAPGAAGSEIRFHTTKNGTNSNGERVRITNDGNLGIGVTAPQAGLDVATVGTLASAIIVPRDTTANRPSTTVNGMIRYNSSTAKFEAFENGAWTNLIAAGGGTTSFPLLANPGTTPASSPSYAFNGSPTTGLFSQSAGSLALATTGTARLTVLNNGNVGVGTASPAERFVSVGDSNAYGLALDNSSSDGASNFWRAGASGAAWGAGDNSLVFTYETAMSSNYSFALNGADGLATFRVKDYATSSNYAGMVLESTSAAGQDVGPSIRLSGMDGSGPDRTFAIIAGKKENATPGNYNSYLALSTRANGGSTAERMRIASSGNVGIGTTSPAVALEVAMTGTNSAILVPRDTTANRPAANAANGMLRYNTSTAKFEAYESGAWTNLIAAGGGAPTFPLLASPGTTPASAPSYSFSGNANTGFFSPATNSVALATNGAAQFVIDGSGRAGLGISPAANKKLYVSESRTDTGAVNLGTFGAETNANPASASSARFTAAYLNVNAQGSQNFAKVYSTIADTTMDGSGTVADMRGFVAIPWFNSGTVSSYGGFVVDPQNNGTITLYKGVDIKAPVAATVSESRAINIDDQVGSTNQYGIYQAGTDDKNYFAGSIGVGVASPSEKVEITGNLKVNGQAYSGAQTSSAASPLTFNANLGNSMVWTTNTVAPTVNVQNMKAGASYMVVVNGSGTGTVSITCSSDAGVTNLPPSFVPSNGARTTGTLNKTMYNLVSDGTNCLVTWVTGF